MTPPQKPSDMLGLAVAGGLFLFAVYVCIKAARVINFDAFIKGIAWIILLAFVGCVLIVIFQTGYPGH